MPADELLEHPPVVGGGHGLDRQRRHIVDRARDRAWTSPRAAIGTVVRAPTGPPSRLAGSVTSPAASKRSSTSRHSRAFRRPVTRVQPSNSHTVHANSIPFGVDEVKFFVGQPVLGADPLSAERLHLTLVDR